MSRLKLAVACALCLSALLALPAAASYQGKFRGTTAQGKPISFVVGAGDRIVSLNLAYALPGCDAQQNVNTSVPIKGGSFTFSLNLPNNSVSVTGRFSSSSQAAGTLTASSDCGRASTTWKAAGGGATPTASAPKSGAPAKKKAKPEPTTPFDGSWMGSVTFPGGLDPELLDSILPDLGLGVFGGGFESVDYPLLIQGAGCATGAELQAKEFSPPAKFKGKRFSISFTTKQGVEVTLAGTFDSAKRAHGTLTTKGTLKGCDGGSRLAWRASNIG